MNKLKRNTSTSKCREWWKNVDKMTARSVYKIPCIGFEKDEVVELIPKRKKTMEFRDFLKNLEKNPSTDIPLIVHKGDVVRYKRYGADMTYLVIVDPEGGKVTLLSECCFNYDPATFDGYASSKRGELTLDSSKWELLLRAQP